MSMALIVTECVASMFQEVVRVALSGESCVSIGGMPFNGLVPKGVLVGKTFKCQACAM